MKPRDAAKAVGVGGLALALNLGLTTLAITVYSLWIEPGHDEAFYRAAAPGIANWTAPPGGALLLLGSGVLLGRRQERRPALALALVAWAGYVALDAALGMAAAGARSLSDRIFMTSLLLALLGAVAGGLAGAAPTPRRERPAKP
jgi:hypothetical protein